ncbi:MAG: cellulase family glycosylhydrolase [Reinekea sp.]|nr:cellulase family glycosylhydrolase [Reinekea sp.]
MKDDSKTLLKDVLAWVFAGLVIAFGLALISKAEAHSTGYIHANNKSFHGPTGQPFRMKGFNLPEQLMTEGWLIGAPYAKMNGVAHEPSNRTYLNNIEAGYADFYFNNLKNNYLTATEINLLVDTIGANVFRVPVAAWMFTDYDAYARLDSIITWANAKNAYVMIDLHTTVPCQNDATFCDPNLPDNAAPFWDSTAGQNGVIALWKEIATRYKNQPAVLGYNLVNEPNNYPHSITEKTEIWQFYIAAINEIRTVDTNHLIILDGDNWAGELDLFKKRTNPPFNPETVDSNWAMGFHDYSASGCNLSLILQYGEAQYLANKKAQLTTRLQSVFADVADVNVPVIVGEYGAECDLAQQAYHEVFDEQGIQHTFYFAPFGVDQGTVFSMILARYPAPYWDGYTDVLGNGNKPSGTLATQAFTEMLNKTGLAIDVDRLSDFQGFFQ